jgi:hypothetical protein
MEDKKIKKINNIFELENEVIRMASFGAKKDDIINDIIRKCSSKFMVNQKAIAGNIERILQDYVGFDWIQKVMRSKILLDMKDQKYYLFDYTQREKIDTAWETIRTHINPKLDLKRHVHVCKFEYNPLSPETLRKSNKGYYIYNTYIPPFWYEDLYYDNKEIPKERKIPEMYYRFLMHLLNNHKESYEYVLNWLSNAIRDRNRCALVTIGKQGIGKGVLGEIMRRLVGNANFYEGKDKMFKDRFNSQIKDRRIVYCDEFVIKNPEDEDRLKSMANDNIEIEGKGVDTAGFTNYASLYMSSNRKEALRLSADDRRFSIVELTQEKLALTWSREQIAELLKTENIEKLARFLYHREYDIESMTLPFKTDYANEIKAASLYQWQEWFLEDYCLDYAGKEIKLDVIRDKIGEEFGYNNAPGYAKFQKLEEDFPNKLHVARKREGNKRVWYIQIKSLKEQGVE